MKEIKRAVDRPREKGGRGARTTANGKELTTGKELKMHVVLVNTTNAAILPVDKLVDPIDMQYN